MKLLKMFLTIIKWSLTVFLTVIALYVINSSLNIFGLYRSFAVRSGSMEPAIMTGDVIIVKQQTEYYPDDVITFYNGDHELITHRLKSIEADPEKKYYTKGDANRSFDDDNISLNQIVGKVTLIIPKLGYLMAFVRTPKGWLILVLIPAALYILDELIKIVKNAK